MYRVDHNTTGGYLVTTKLVTYNLVTDNLVTREFGNVKLVTRQFGNLHFGNY